MELAITDLHSAEWAQKGIQIPAFDVAAMVNNGQKKPRWVHIGPGNIFRVFLARIADDLISNGYHWPITVVTTRDPRRMDRQLNQYDLLTLGVTLNPNGHRDLRVIAGICEALATQRADDYGRLLSVSSDPGVTLISLTITEKGYMTVGAAGEQTDEIRRVVKAGPQVSSSHAMVVIAQMLWQRFEASAAPITLLSCDNFSHNGDILRKAVLGIATGWMNNSHVSSEFVDWVSDETKVAFPVTVIDKITPQPNPGIASDLEELGIQDMKVDASLGTPLAGFVNTEPVEYLIVEDKFAGERPPFEDFGVRIVERQVCDDFEQMKVTTCLNPLHTALAVSGCLLGFPTIDSEMHDHALAELARRLGGEEGMRVVVDPGIVDPHDFLKEVLEVRFPNPYLPDSPHRIAADTSQKIPIRFGQTLKAYRERGLSMDDLHAIPLTFALWLRYLLGVDDNGDLFELSPDPLLEQLRAQLAEVELERGFDAHAVLQPLLSNPRLFGIDLYTTPLGAKTEEYFSRLCSGLGAVRTTLDMEMA